MYIRVVRWRMGWSNKNGQWWSVVPVFADATMHLKNFSLFKDPKKGYNLSPAYDMVAAQLVVKGDDEELALTLNGKKSPLNLVQRAFSSAGRN